MYDKTQRHRSEQGEILNPRKMVRSQGTSPQKTHR
jgi:hypothetical protein